ncbi:polyketide synthase dehydratase domain-containing protein, partial [Streptomyces sp. G44]|uniref:polyketide synthase dehydratase domain-containing protein n=1 Tax=Streptomyces sp. G44 TaxID=2807632 RepID=UPI001960C0A5
HFWLEPGVGDADVVSAGLEGAGHPLLGAAVSLPDVDGFLLTGRLSLRSHPWLGEHVVDGSVLLPGTAFVELAVRAGDEAGCGRVEDLTLEAPLVLPAQGAVQLQVVVGAPDGQGARPVRIYSRLEQAEG